MKILLSIHPQFADLIMSGDKTVELRRRIPALTRGDVVYVYATSPIQQVVGWFIVDKLTTGSPAHIWKTCGRDSHVSRKDFDLYFLGRDRGHGIGVGSRTILDQPIPLRLLTKLWRGFTPPQSFRYVPEAIQEAIIGHGQTKVRAKASPRKPAKPVTHDARPRRLTA